MGSRWAHLLYLEIHCPMGSSTGRAELDCGTTYSTGPRFGFLVPKTKVVTAL